MTTETARNFQFRWRAAHSMPLQLILQSTECYGAVSGYNESFDANAEWVRGDAAAALGFHATGTLPSLSVRLPDGWAVLGNNDNHEAGGKTFCEGHECGPWPLRALAQCRFLMDHDVRFVEEEPVRPDVPLPPTSLRARLVRYGDAATGGSWRPPLIGGNSAVVVTEEQIAAAYEDVQQFIDSFDGHYERNGQILVWRGLELIKMDGSWARYVYRHAGQLARIAKPGLTAYNAGPGLEKWERDIFLNEGTNALNFVGYLENTRTIVYSAHLSPDRHPLPREYKLLKRLTWFNKDSEGRPVDEVQIHFFIEEMAIREKRPLLDIGCRVFFEDPSAPDGVREVLV